MFLVAKGMEGPCRLVRAFLDSKAAWCQVKELYGSLKGR